MSDTTMAVANGGDIALTVSLDDLRQLDKGAVAELLKAAMRTGSMDGQEAMLLASECSVTLID